MDNQYEQHLYEDPRFPVIFHLDELSDSPFVPHWHQNLEFLYFRRGTVRISIDAEIVSAGPGDVVVIPANAIHIVSCDPGERAQYYCLIVDWSFCESCGLPMDEIWLERRIHDSGLNKIMNNIVAEFQREEPFYKPRILSGILDALVLLSRKHRTAPPEVRSTVQASRLKKIRQVLLYIEKNFDRELSLDALAAYAGFSKYYFCHIFKVITGMTPVEFINFTRCRRARELLGIHGYSVSEAASQCGFDNLSYFTKIYKKYIGESPSQTKNTAPAT